MKKHYYLLIILVLVVCGCSPKAAVKKIVPQPEPQGTCIVTQECNGDTALQCFQDWLTRSRCFSKEYIDMNMTSFRVSSEDPSGNFLEYRYSLDGQNLCPGNYPDCGAVVSNKDGVFKVIGVYGPLKEYSLVITRAAAEQIIKNDPKCSKDAHLGDMALTIGDRFDWRQGDKAFDYQGIYWFVQTGNWCGRTCSVNAMTGKLIIGEYGCV